MRILAIRFRNLGDVLLTFPAVEALKRAHPSAEIEYVADDVLAPLLERNPAVSRIHASPRARRGRSGAVRGVVADLEFTARLARRRYEVVVDFSGRPHAAALAFLTGAPGRIGYRHVRFRNRAYTRRVAVTWRLGPHTVHCHLELAEAAGATAPGDPRPKVYLGEDERRGAREALGELAGRPFVAIHPGGSHAVKKWPPERFAALARWAGERFSLPAAVFAGPAEEAAGRLIAERSGASLFTGLGIRDLAARIGEAAVFCGNDSGPAHLAAALDVPALTIVGPSSPVRWAPLVKPRRIVTPPSGPAPAHEVSLDAVKGAFAELVSEAGLR